MKRIGPGATIVAVVVMVVATTVMIAPIGVAQTVPPESEPGVVTQSSDPVPGQYIVRLRSASAQDVPQKAAELTRGHGGAVLDVYESALHGYSARMSAAEARALAGDPAVAAVEEDGFVHAATTQTIGTSGSWGLDRIDQHDLPLDSSYTYQAEAALVHAYVIDSGILATHPDFGGRATLGHNSVADGNPVCSTTSEGGHGTHVAGVIGGTTYGVAKAIPLVSVRVLNCNGSGTFSDVIDGVDWVTAHAVKPAVANMSLAGAASTSLDAAVQGSIASGITYVVAAGNSNGNACSFSPARVFGAITVAATGKSDSRAAFSNTGTCVDVFAPGESILSDWIGTAPGDVKVVSGTSMSAPFVAGVAAQYLAANPCASPNVVSAAITANATPGKVTDAGDFTTTSVLFSGFIGPDAAPQGPCSAPALTATATSGSGSIHLSWTVPSNGGAPLHFEVSRGTAPGSESYIATLNDQLASSYDDACLPPGTYYYRVTARNDHGTAASDEASATPAAPGTPVLSASATNNSVHLSWTVPPGNGCLVGYHLYRGTAAGAEAPAPIQTLGAGTTSYDDTGVVSGTTYFYEVTASNSVAEGSRSNEVSAQPRPMLDAFVLGGDNQVWWRRASGGTWAPWTPLGGFLTSDPTSVSNASGVWLFARGGDAALYYRRFDGSSWSPWTSLGGLITSNAAAVSTAGTVRVFARGGDNALYSGGFVGNGSFSGWVSLGGLITSNPAVSSDGSGVQVFARGGDNAVYAGSFTSSFSGWHSLGGLVTSDPAAAFDGSATRVFARGGDGALYTGQGLGPSLTGFGWQPLGGFIASNPSVVSDAPGRVRVFVRGGDNGVYNRSSASNWAAPYEALGNFATSNPVSVFDGQATFLFVRGGDNALWTGVYGNSWSSWSSLSGVLNSNVAVAASP